MVHRAQRPIIAVVPAKAHSSRAPDKNYRPFYESSSLVDLTISKLKRAGFDAGDIYLSCEDPRKREVAMENGVRFLLRDSSLVDNDVPMIDCIRGVCAQVYDLRDDVDVAWAQVIDPMFHSYAQCVKRWRRFRDEYDSLAVRYRLRQYMMDSTGHPIGWGFGPWHVKSQLLPLMYLFTFTFSILSPESVRDVGYHVGADPIWYELDGPVIDIDTERDFEIAQAMYSTAVARGEIDA
jgi:CMP-N-acetylneuraminic acid synthetase